MKNTTTGMEQTEAPRMDRRSLLVQGGVLAAMAGAGSAFAQGEHEHHHHHGGGGASSLAAAAHDCLATGEACLAHCMVTFQEGDTTLAQCANSVLELMASCSALAQLANFGSEFTPAFAGAALQVCKACEVECRKHEHHPECKACADSCAACIEECKKVAI